MYKQIKTVMNTSPYNFDRQVNADLQDGWELVKHLTIPTGGELCHYALLERYEMGEADKCCDNCKHCDTPPTGTPCSECDDASEWEPPTGAPCSECDDASEWEPQDESEEAT